MREGEGPGGVVHGGARPELSRRTALKQGAVIVAGVAWVPPAIQVVSMSSAAAVSAPPGGVIGGGGPGNSGGAPYGNGNGNGPNKDKDQDKDKDNPGRRPRRVSRWTYPV